MLGRAKAVGFKNLIITLDTMLIGWRPLDLKRAYLPFVHGVGTQMGFSDPTFMAKYGLKPSHAAPVFPYDQDTLNTVVNSEQSSAYADALRQRVKISEDWMMQHINSGWFPTWENLKFVRANWEGPVILKGIMCVEDAEMALDAGCEGIIVSNHGTFSFVFNVLILRMPKLYMAYFHRRPSSRWWVIVAGRPRRYNEVVENSRSARGWQIHDSV